MNQTKPDDPRIYFRWLHLMYSSRDIWEIGIAGSFGSSSGLTRFWPMSAPDFTFLTIKSFEKRFKHERGLRSLVIPILDVLLHQQNCECEWVNIIGNWKNYITNWELRWRNFWLVSLNWERRNYNNTKYDNNLLTRSVGINAISIK